MPTLVRRFDLTYPAGTRTATSRVDLISTELIQPHTIWKGIVDALDHYIEEHGEGIPRDDLFITIGFSTTEVLVEVSDRLRG